MRLLQAALFFVLGSTGALRAEAPNVITDIAPVHSLVTAAMAGVAEPQYVVPSGASPHDMSLRPSMARALQTADLVFWIGPELTPWLADALPDLASHAEKIPLLAVAGTTVLPPRDFEEAMRDEDHGHGHDHHGDIDPHAWLDPLNGIVWAEAIARKLATVDPENAESYEKNAKDLIDRIQAEIDAINTLDLDETPPRYLASHDALQYFEARFGISAVGAIADSEAAPPTAARLRRLKELLSANPVKCVLAEPGFNANLIASVVDLDTVKVHTFDVLGSQLPEGPDLYPALIAQLAAIFDSCR